MDNRFDLPSANYIQMEFLSPKIVDNRFDMPFANYILRMSCPDTMFLTVIFLLALGGYASQDGLPTPFENQVFCLHGVSNDKKKSLTGDFRQAFE
ncbi:MAG: hypothetical protein I3J02_10105 [Prevotella sp.]|nr:hypothetical protein [Prevotella sp.]